MDYKKRLEGVYTDNSFAFFHDGPIVRGSTQVHSFRIPNDITNIREVFVTYNQRETVYTSEVIDNKVTLSEADTFKFKANEETAVQLKITTETEYIVSPIFYIEVEKGLDELQKTYDDDFYTIDITVNKQSIHALPYSIEAINDTSLKCKFTFDSTWNGKQKIVYFKDEFNHLIKTPLSYNWCLIPTIILSNPGIINIGVYSDASRSTIWSNDINVAAGLLHLPHLPDIDSGTTEAEGVLADKLNTEISRAKAAEAALSGKINDEISRATLKENDLNTKIEAETTRATTAEGELRTSLDTEIQRATAKENELETKLNTETQRAIAKENELETNLNTEIQRATTKENEIVDNLEKETSSRISEDNALSSRIDSEASSRESNDNLLNEKIESEITRAKGAEQKLTTDLANEIARAKQAEVDNATNIQTMNRNLASEVNRATTKENEIVDNLNSEISRAKVAESTNATNIADEITRSKKAEEVLTTNLSTEVSDRKKADNNLQTQIDAINSRSDVVDVVATKAELDAYDKDISINDIVKVLQDGTHDNATSYYRNTTSSKPYVWEFIGSLGPYYTQSQTDGLISNEATLRENKDNELNTKIDTEIDRAKKAEQANTTLINNETSRAKGTESELDTKITTEVNRATGVESTLGGKIDDEISRAKAKENELNTKFANYLLKSDAPGYADILTKTLASTTYVSKDDAPGYADILTTTDAKTTYVAKNEATGYNDILTKTVASATYETIENASNYVAKSEAVGYDNILTKTEASTIYETKQNATSTYETKANATATYETKANASTTYETKANATATYETKANASTTYETKANATATYETKANATATYETKANTSDVLSLEEIQASTDLTGKIASASAFAPFFNVKQGNLAKCVYIQIGKLVVVSFKGTLSNGTSLGIPQLLNNCIITLRDESVGGIAQVTLGINATVVKDAGSSNFVDGHDYAGIFAYVCS